MLKCCVVGIRDFKKLPRGSRGLNQRTLKRLVKVRAVEQYGLLMAPFLAKARGESEAMLREVQETE